MITPFSFLAERVSLGPRALRWGTTAALVASILIIFFGGVVRLTGSGLGCPTWPACEAGSLTSTPELGIHGVIEFTNRAFTGVLVVAVGWAITVARLQKPRDRTMTRLAWSQFWLVVANALAGGATVHSGLNPYIVAGHFVLAIALLTTTALTWHRAHRSPSVAFAPDRTTRALSIGLVALTLLVILIGTLVTGTGPHAGDSAEVPRMQFHWESVTVVHGVLGTAVLLAGAALFVRLSRAANSGLARRRVVTFLVVVLLQALVGIVQSLTALPEAIVAVHLLGSAVVWVGVVRVLLDVNPRLFTVRAQRSEAAAQLQPAG
ncbi:cytochrome oxidase assembly protein [Rathayibacter rathayi]|uniref:Cytochrome oxidase assembly protein n=1 Tax=Rathayibacter rathayi TaxID=33887 RepID=A0ABD6WBJ9_RATRA|nr:COX15/CtaA family protein [Rathayibacter rathayi]AZZ48736.1 cytochrome oxidase assembly protein [Rathayibacter rathayi]PPF15733.1 cytochrome oxidase assembly protein [Rathayibacter rathayi]PPF50820.1 cytochrome oxidase assembly protein [Rathayibacter rathayi]PPF82373.1 cytochrome oxidase assembly protein [Rathayibacter rathayi]PPG15462.1 cytochrome oxidase assembly protein [Rathayibacter rathayi]